ncbi:MAG: hypothetical protein N4R38_01460 [Lactobacillus crispatus]|nr:hypothetical protein [Lactobacillus crispatus]
MDQFPQIDTLFRLGRETIGLIGFIFDGNQLPQIENLDKVDSPVD